MRETREHHVRAPVGDVDRDPVTLPIFLYPAAEHGLCSELNVATPMTETREAMVIYTPWKLHTQVTLERTCAPSVPIRQLPARNRAVQLPVFTALPSGHVEATFYVERVLSRRVAVVADCTTASSTRWVIKFYAFDWVSRWHLDKENAAYAACKSLQGNEVPLFYGQWSIGGTSANTCCALMMEFALPGTTIAEIRDGMVELEGEELALARGRLVRLQNMVVAAVDQLQACRVLHLDLAGDNMVVAVEMEQEAVVLVGFSWAMVQVVDGGWKMGDRWTLFQMGFLESWDGVQQV